MIRSMLSRGHHNVSVRSAETDREIYARRIVGQVEEESHTVETAILLKVLSEETRRLHVDSHGSEDDREIVFMSVVDALGGCRLGVAFGRLLVDKSGLTTNLGSELVGVEGGRQSRC